MNLIVLLVPTLAFWPWSAKEYHMAADSSVPAAVGNVKVTKDKDNGNTRLDIKVDHLAKPSSLTPSEAVYLVWVKPRDGSPIRQGAIGVNKTLTGELKVVTVAKEFDLFITAEQNNSTSEPTGVEVFTGTHSHQLTSMTRNTTLWKTSRSAWRGWRALLESDRRGLWTEPPCDLVDPTFRFMTLDSLARHLRRRRYPSLSISRLE